MLGWAVHPGSSPGVTPDFPQILKATPKTWVLLGPHWKWTITAADCSAKWSVHMWARIIAGKTRHITVGLISNLTISHAVECSSGLIAGRNREGVMCIEWTAEQDRRLQRAPGSKYRVERNASRASMPITVGTAVYIQKTWFSTTSERICLFHPAAENPWLFS